jgi:dTDP-glucose 4,6-dehydratase
MYGCCGGKPSYRNSHLFSKNNSMTGLLHSTLLVTGGAGFIGSSFVSRAVALGHKVIVLDKLTYAGFRENILWIQTPSPKGGAWQLVEGDICDGAMVLALLREHQVDAVVDFAAESHVDNSIAKPGAFIHTNIIGCYTMLEAARTYYAELEGAQKEQFRLVHISTDEVYGSLGPTGRFSETTSMKPNSPYSASKAAGDHLCRAWHETYGLPVIVTNCSNNYGARQHPEKLLPKIITHAISGKPLPIYGDGQNIRDWIHVEDHVAGLMLGLTEGESGETYCFGGHAEKTNLEVVQVICDILDDIKSRSDGASYREQITFVEDRAGHDRRYAIDDSKAEGLLGFTRNYSFESGIRQTIEWYLANEAWCRIVTQKGA